MQVWSEFGCSPFLMALFHRRRPRGRERITGEGYVRVYQFYSNTFPAHSIKSRRIPLEIALCMTQFTPCTTAQLDSKSQTMRPLSNVPTLLLSYTNNVLPRAYSFLVLYFHVAKTSKHIYTVVRITSGRQVLVLVKYNMKHSGTCGNSFTHSTSALPLTSSGD